MGQINDTFVCMQCVDNLYMCDGEVLSFKNYCKSEKNKEYIQLIISVHSTFYRTLSVLM